MKKSNELKVITVLLIILIIILISFLGIYSMGSYKYEDVLPKYNLGMDLEGAISIEMSPDDTEEEIAKDSEGNVVEDYEEGQEGITIETTRKNNEDVFVWENYIKTKEIIEKRLKQLGLNEYRIRLNEVTGNIIVELSKNVDTDIAISTAVSQGKFEIIDSETEEVLLTNEDIKSTDAFYNTSATGATAYLSITFNKEGAKKLEEVSTIYQKITEEEEATESEEDNEEEEAVEEKKVTIRLDGEDFVTTSFGETMTTGVLSISIGSETTDSEVLSNDLNQAIYIGSIIGNGEMPIVYALDNANYLMPISKNISTIVLIVLAVLVAISILVLIIKYGIKGIWGWLSVVSFAGLTLLLVRLTRNYYYYKHYSIISIINNS